MTSPLVSRDEALAKPMHHQYVIGIGYLAHDGPPDLPASASGRKGCCPKKDAAEGSLHVMKPPNGAGPVIMLWSRKHQAWSALNPGKGNRMAWSAEFLMRAGWEYVRPAKES